jgi:predicted NUDIX family NTP pyrophosphohydrolase
MAKKSAGILLYREASGVIEVLLVHPGGPFWAEKDEGAWSIPKGEFGDDEPPFAAAKREFAEETGVMLEGEGIALEPVRQPGGKIVYAWAIQHDCDPSGLKSNTFSVEWPPKSGHVQEFREVDRAAWFTIEKAARKILKGQAPLLDQLESKLRASR